MPNSVIPQRIVNISINSTANGLKCRYSYVSPVTGMSYQDAPVCDLKVNGPIYCLFVLDYASTAAGWVIENITAAPPSPLIPFVIGANNLSIETYDADKTTPQTVYKFFIGYQNTLTGQAYQEDPQEGNGPS